mmetsp:Transcript_14047/g.16280  ORF Transcript_14047/g.16280 Transcript_14047/m.16280 type:complete len:81 (-) Transcript_14047:7-249(-)
MIFLFSNQQSFQMRFPNSNKLKDKESPVRENADIKYYSPYLSKYNQLEKMPEVKINKLNEACIGMISRPKTPYIKDDKGK